MCRLFGIAKGTCKQALLAACVSLSFFCIGLVRGYSSPAVPSILERNPDILFNQNIVSWTSSIPPCGAFIGSLLSGPLMHMCGRKWTLLIASPVWTISWTIIAMADRWEVMLAGRLLSGLCVGISLPAAQIYVTECCGAHIRGVLGSFPSLAMSAGILLAYVAGTFMPWHQLAWLCAAISFALLFAIVHLPESPVWLASTRQFERANASAAWLHLPDVFAAKCVATKKDGDKDTATAAGDFSRKTLLSRPILRPFAIGLTIMALQQLTGIDAIIFFTVEIFRAAGSSVNANVATIIVGGVQLVSNVSSLFVVDRFGRKPLLITSGAIMTVSMATMGYVFHSNENGGTVFGILPLASLVVFMIGFSIGFGCIPFLLLGELFPAPQRSLLSSWAGSFNLAVMFVVIKTYHPLEAAITRAGTFWMYAVLCAIAILFVSICLPETKGHNLDSIALLFDKTNDKCKATTVLFGIDNQVACTENVDGNGKTGNGNAHNEHEITKL